MAIIAAVSIRVPALIVAALLLLQFTPGCHPCSGCEDDAGPAAVVVDHGGAFGDQHHDDHGTCSCACHATAVAVTGYLVLGDATVERLPIQRPPISLPPGYLLTSKPPPRT